MRDSKNNIGVLNAFDIQAITSNTTTVGDIIDLQGEDSATFVIQSGTLTDGAYAVLIEEGDIANMSDASAVADLDLVGTEALAGFALTDDNTVKRIGYIGTKRYIRLSLVSTAITTGGTLGAVVLFAHSSVKPVA